VAHAKQLGTDLILKQLQKLVGVGVIALALAACASGPKGIRFTDGTDSSAPKPQAQPIRKFTGTEIQAAITGKTFQYTRSDGSGFVTYNANGTSTFQDDTKGNGSGKWETSNDEFCEIFGAKAIQECGDFKSTGDAYFAGKSRLVEMKN
jgi:hypothetical protein